MTSCEERKTVGTGGGRWIFDPRKEIQGGTLTVQGNTRYTKTRIQDSLVRPHVQGTRRHTQYPRPCKTRSARGSNQEEGEKGGHSSDTGGIAGSGLVGTEGRGLVAGERHVGSHVGVGPSLRTRGCSSEFTGTRSSPLFGELSRDGP